MRCRSICWRMGFVPTMCLMTSFLILSLLVLLAALLRHFISHVLIFLSVFLMIVHVWAWDLRVGVNVVPMMVLTAGWDSSGPIKKVTLFDFWHRVSISLSCLPSSVNISIPNILLNTVIIFNLNHNLVHRNFLYSCQFISGIYCLSMMICTCIVVFIPRPNLFRLGLYSRLWKLKIEDRLIFSMSMFIDTCGVP